MEPLLYWLARAVIASLQALPLTWVARLGRAGGAAIYWLDARHRRVTLRNLDRCFAGEKTPRERRALARENFRRIGESFASSVKTALMSPEGLRPHFEFAGADQVRPAEGGGPRNLVVAIGHFGNFELYARSGQFLPGLQCATTYRGLRQGSLDRLLQSLRQRSGCLYFERRSEATALRAAMSKGGLLLGLLADQHAGRHGLRLPFFGHECATSAAPALFALRYTCPLHTAVCYRIALARWRVELGPEIPTRAQGHPRPAADIMRDVNRAFETAVRRDPANWFWVHNRWKPEKLRRPPARRVIPRPPLGGETAHPLARRPASE